ncbi:26216_t:CDS:2, partial [Dentiscutata erythropus]
MSLINHKKIHRKYYQVEDKTDTSFSTNIDESTDNDISNEPDIISKQNNKKNIIVNCNSIYKNQDSANKSYPVFDAQKIKLDLTCDDQETTDESDSMFDDQETINESDSIVENRENINKSDLILNNQETSNETNSIFDNYKTKNELNSIFDNDEENANDLNEIFEEDILEDSKETEDELWSNDSKHDNIDFSNVESLHFLDTLKKNRVKFSSTPVAQ